MAIPYLRKPERGGSASAAFDWDSGLVRCLSMNGTSSEKIKHIPLDIAA